MGTAKTERPSTGTLELLILLYNVHLGETRTEDWDMSPDEFKVWRRRMSWTQQQAADALDISKATVVNYEAGRRRDTGQPVDVPYAIAVTCDALAARAETDPDFVLRMATTTTADGLPTEGEAERLRAMDTQLFLDRVYAGLIRSQKGTADR